jgi:hypothetical protein
LVPPVAVRSQRQGPIVGLLSQPRTIDFNGVIGAWVEIYDEGNALKAAELSEYAVSDENVEVVRRGFQALNRGARTPAPRRRCSSGRAPGRYMTRPRRRSTSRAS